MLRSSFLVNLEVCRLIATLQLYYRMNSFTGIFQQRFKLPPCFDVGPHPPSNFDMPLPSQRGGGGTASPHVCNTYGKPCEEVYFFVMVIYILRIWHQICNVTSRRVLVLFIQYGCPVNFFLTISFYLHSM